MQNSNLFVDREEELKWLNEIYRKEKAQLILIYGRRRVGKSFLLTNFVKKENGLYYLCSQENEREQISQLSRSLGELFNDSALKLNPFSNWESFFLYLYEKTKEKKFSLIIDEFPYLVNVNPAIPSIFQKYWDLYLKNSKLCLILSGSSISIMESVGIEYNAPLYGRRTGQWKLMPLKFKNVTEFFEQNFEEIIRFYSISGGIPFYIVELDNKKTAIENIYENILKKGSVFYDEGEILLKSELKDSSAYFSILKTMAEGTTKQVNIANKIGFKASSLPKYLSTLMRLGFINKTSSILEKDNSKKVRYEIKDNFINFWFKFVEPAKRYVEEKNQEEIKKMLSWFELYVSKKFENLVREEIFTEINKKMKILEAKKIGRWWGYKRENGERKSIEIDLVALNQEKKEILFGECKWEDKVNAMQVINQLAEKAKYVEWPSKGEKEKRKEYFAVFAKTFSKRITEFEGKKVFCFDLIDIEKGLRAK